MRQYYSPKELAGALGVSESSVKRWSDGGRIRMVRTTGGHRRIPVAEAVRFIRQSRRELAHPETLGFLPSRADERPPDDLLYDLLRGGLESDAVALVQSLYLRGWGVERILDGPFRAALERLGKLWIEDETRGVLWEHRATQQCTAVLQRLRLLFEAPRQPEHRAVGAALSGDPYLLPTMAVATTLESVGYRALNLGPETPVASLVQAIAELAPRLVWVSQTAAPAAPNDLRTLRDAAAAHEAVLVIGGQAGAHAGIPPGVQRMDTLAELGAFARGLSAL